MATDISRPPPPELPEFRAAASWSAAPARTMTLADGREALAVGDPERYPAAEPAPEGSAGAARSLALVGQALQGLGYEISLSSLVERAVAEGFCETGPEAAASVDLSLEQLRHLLAAVGARSVIERGASLEDLAQNLETGGVLLAVNAGEIWSAEGDLGSGDANHAVLATAAARDPVSGDLLGCFISDPVSGPNQSFVAVETILRAWLDSGGIHLIIEPANP